MQKCDECLRLEALLQESGRDHLAAANRYNTLLGTDVDHSWAAEALRTAKAAHDAALRRLDEHVEKHGQPARMAAGAYGVLRQENPREPGRLVSFLNAPAPERGVQ